MHSLEGKYFFDHIRRSVKISYFVASLIPLALLVYFSIKYVYPYVTAGDIANTPLDIQILVVLAVVLSILGLILTTKATNSSIGSVQELNTRINSLFDITKQIRETHHLDILLKKIMTSAMNLTEAESGSLFLFDEEGSLKSFVNTGLSSQEMGLKKGEGIASWVGKTGQPALIHDLSKDARFNQYLDKPSGFKTISVICVPLIHADEIIGVVELRNKKHGVFTQQDQALLQSLADQASLSIVSKKSGEKQHSDFIHITEILVGAQDSIQHKQGHVRSVAGYANLIGRHLSFPESDLKKLHYASLLHDIGMLKMDLSKGWEMDHIVEHPKLGYDLIKSISLWSGCADIILHHHERYDGTGYPLSKKGEEIPLGARILFVADTFDVLTSNNSYQKKMTFDEALREIEAHSGSQFDPKIVQAFRDAMAEAGMI